MTDGVIGIDIGGTNLRLALVAEGGDIVKRLRLSSRIEDGLDCFCERLLQGIAELTAQAAASRIRLAGIGVGVPGLVDSDGLIRSSVNMRPLDGFNLASFLRHKSGLPVQCANDANAIAAGEQIYGAGRGRSSFIVITIGTGLGSGLILNGKLWQGSGGFASEFGHVTVDPRGPVCHCGNQGCLEQYVSASALVRSFSEISMARSGHVPLATAEDVARLARDGNAAALQAFSEMGRWLGIALASLSNLMNLEAVIVGGGVGSSLDLLEAALRAELEARCFAEIYAGIDVVMGELGDDAGLLGAAALLKAAPGSSAGRF